ncbi:nucleotidyltransferase domain-containing protein [Salinibacterium sp. GXW1014]|uniref:nucleotidyltransferase domain-containing protein n=1 Tax=Salinibacterium sp. GXW1014 TaxID=3377838 RepID=UPI00383AC63E
MAAGSVIPVADARAGLSTILRKFRDAPDLAEPVTIGSHRKPEAVIVPFERFSRMTEGDSSRQKSTLDDLCSRSSLVRRIASLNKIQDVAVFGSVARRADTAESDIDLLATLTDDGSLFDLAQFEIDMEQLTGRKVEVVSRRSLDPLRDAHILAEAVLL